MRLQFEVDGAPYRKKGIIPSGGELDINHPKMNENSRSRADKRDGNSQHFNNNNVYKRRSTNQEYLNKQARISNQCVRQTIYLAFVTFSAPIH